MAEDADSDGTGVEDDGEDGLIAFASEDFGQVDQDKGAEEFLVSHQEVDGESFGVPVLPEKLADEIHKVWQAFLQKYPSRELAGEAIYDAIMEEAPTLQPFFKMPRSLFGIRFTMSLTNIFGSCKDAALLKRQVETLGFQHMDLELTAPRVQAVRDIILGVMETELGTALSPAQGDAVRALLNYTGGAFLYVKREFAGRIRVILRSWGIANRKEAEPLEPMGSQLGSVSLEDEPQVEQEEVSEVQMQDNEEIAAILEATQTAQGKGAKVPTSFNEMFLFNASVMGFSESKWMKQVLEHWDAIATHVANSSRLQEECDIMSLVLAKYKGPMNLSEFKAVMLASLRSVLPKDWDMQHEQAWTWLWENVELKLKSMMGTPQSYEKVLTNWTLDLSEQTRLRWRKKIYRKFFKEAPAGQSFLKQSTGRLHFIADRVLEMSLELYREPLETVDVLSAVGLRHVGYGVPTELVQPLVSAYVEALEEECAHFEKHQLLVESFRWALELLAKMLVRVITEGSTVVMKAINTNHELALKKAVAVAPRGQRADELLNVSCGTQSISPLFWAIDSGSLNCARAIIEVYQENVYREGKKFYSFKKVLRELQAEDAETYKDTQLISFHSTSKGIIGECGQRGGYMEYVGFSDTVLTQFTKMAATSLSSNTLGQIFVGLMVTPPKPGEPSYELFSEETQGIFSGLKRRAERLTTALSTVPGISCQPIDGAMYAFPSVRLPEKAIKEAERREVEADGMWCLELLEQTGIVTVPGSGFGQMDGTFHFRTTILPPDELLEEVIEKLTSFQKAFMKKYGEGGY